jgi:hypothetical protein
MHNVDVHATNPLTQTQYAVLFSIAVFDDVAS